MIAKRKDIFGLDQWGIDFLARGKFYLDLSAHDQKDLLLDLPPEQRHVWIRLLAPDDAVDVIQEAGPRWRDELLALLDEPTRREVVA